VLAWDYGEFLKPALTTTFGADLEPLGWVGGLVFQVGLEVKR